MAGQSNGPKGYDYLNDLSVEELEELLRTSREAHRADEDAYIDAIAEVMIRKEKEQPTGRLPDVEKAWEELQTEDIAPKAASRVSARRLGRTLAAVAAAAVLVFALMIGAQAMGIDVFGTLARWTNSTFHHVTVPQSEGDPLGPQGADIPGGDIDLTAALGDYAPTWYPQGTEATACRIQTDALGTATQVSFSLPEDGRFYIQLDLYTDPVDINNRAYETDGQLTEEYLSHNRRYFIFSNENYFMATWSNSTTVLTIYGDLTAEELKSIVDSIGG